MNMDVKDSLLDLIGNTPMLRLKSLDTGPCDLYVKLELNNPGGSIKDRVGLSIIAVSYTHLTLPTKRIV